MKPDLWYLYRKMYQCRCFENAVAELWEEGKISGEMHQGVGEEAIVAGVVSLLQEGDAMALDHRGTAPLLARGIDPVALLREFLGRPDGLCGGMGGHMHLFSRQHLAASSGIVGASGPAAAGFALAAQHLRPKAVSVAFFGEGAANQGMLLESLNLAVVWRLPVLFVCKDNQWAFSTYSPSATGGNLIDRANAFGMAATAVDGSDVIAVRDAADEAIQQARSGGGPTFLLASCVHYEGHFLGDPLLRRAHHPIKEMRSAVLPLLRAVLARKGVPVRERIGNLRAVSGLIRNAKTIQASIEQDPIHVARSQLEEDGLRLDELEQEVMAEVQRAVVRAQSPTAIDAMDLKRST